MADGAKGGFLILGGTGFIGSNFANYVARKGAVVTVSGSSDHARVPLEKGVLARAVDATNLSELEALFASAAPETIIFCISRLLPRHLEEFNGDIAFTEMRAVSNMLQCAKDSGVKQIVYCSSGGAVYQESDIPRRETAACEPKSLYGRLKLQAESLIETFAATTGICATILRIANPYGPGQSATGAHGVIPVFLSRMLRDEPITVYGSVAAAKDYFYIDDLNAAIWSAVTRRASGIYNVGSGVPTRLDTIIEKISVACGVAPRYNFQDLPSTDVQSFVLDITRAETLLGWKPQIPLDEGIARTRLWLASGSP